MWVLLVLFSSCVLAGTGVVLVLLVSVGNWYWVKHNVIVEVFLALYHTLHHTVHFYSWYYPSIGTCYWVNLYHSAFTLGAVTDL